MAKRIDQLDGVRTLAIGAVFLHHAFHVKMLWAGVDLFFILSGFLITGILIGAKQKTLGGYFGHFYERRALRILPPYLLLLLMTSVFFGLEWARHWYLYLFLMNMLLPFKIYYLESIEVLWSLAVEEQFYMMWPFAVYTLSETGIAWLAGGLIVLAPILRWVCTPYFSDYWHIYMLTPFRMDLLAMGALLAVMWRQHRVKIERYGVYGPILTALAVVTLVMLSRRSGFSTAGNTREANVWVYELTLIASTGAILWALGGRYVGILKWVPMVYLGRISYSIYLIHVTVLLVMGRYVHNELLAAAFSILLIVGYAAVSWRWIEQPILRWKRKASEAETEFTGTNAQ